VRERARHAYFYEEAISQRAPHLFPQTLPSFPSSRKNKDRRGSSGRVPPRNAFLQPHSVPFVHPTSRAQRAVRSGPDKKHHLTMLYSPISTSTA
jgi:hypothetical protein